MRGSADLLKRIEKPSSLGNWSYVPIECKLASKPKTTFLVQALAYCELLTPHLGNRPEQFELYLGGGTFKKFRTKGFWAWYQQLRDRYAEFLESFDPQAIPEDERGDHGSWSAFIDERLLDQRDLILVADMRESQRQKLRAAGITSIDQLATSPRDAEIPQLDPRVFKQLQEQAEVQCSPKDAEGRPAYRLRSLIEGKGLYALPAANAGDIWFDMEGFHDPVAGTKLEYLFGACYRDGEDKTPQFKAWWLIHRARKKQHSRHGWIGSKSAASTPRPADLSLRRLRKISDAAPVATARHTRTRNQRMAEQERAGGSSPDREARNCAGGTELFDQVGGAPLHGCTPGRRH